MIALLAALALFGWYAWAYRRYHARTARPAVPARVLAFGAGCAVLALALAEPMDGLADASFAWHMTQHLALVLVAAPLLLLGAPLLYLLGTLPHGAARGLARTLHAQPLRALFSPIAAWCAFVAVLWISHFTPLYEAALEHPWVHLGEHALYLSTALLFWSAIVQSGFVPHPVGYPARLALLFLALPQGAFLGVALLQTRAVLYPHYALGRTAAAALADQHDGAAVMWIGGGLLLFAATMIAAAVWAARERGPRLGTTLAMRTRRAVPLVLALALVVVTAAHAGAPPPPPRAPSYTADQARRGELAYIENCAECHGDRQNGKYGPALNGPDGNLQWETVKYVYGYATTQMPAGNAGGLSKRTYLDITAFLLKLHGNPPGYAPLTDGVAKSSLAVFGEAKP